MNTILFSAVFAVVLLSYAAAAITLAKRQRSRRNLKLPEEFKLLRAPGETLRMQVQAITERMFDWLALGSVAALSLALAPLLLLKLNPQLNPFALLVSSAALFIAASVFVVRRMRTMIDERSNKWLGYMGERLVGEALLTATGSGYRLLHDVPAEMGNRKENLDHVAVGTRGVVVIETKTRSKPTDIASGNCVVEFDGKQIVWPRNPSDRKTLSQVAGGAAWLQRLIRNECSIEVPVRQVIAIPGWKVNERVCIEPRVVSGRGVADAVADAKGNREHILTADQIDQICNRLAELCRDVVE